MRARYGLDAPGVVVNLFVAAALGLLAAVALRGTRWAPLGYGLGGVAAGCLVCGIGMAYVSRVGKLRTRDRLLGVVEWRGDERVLDVGCGRGLLLVGAARRLTTGRAVGIDVWSARDLSGNSAGATLRNARAAGVADRVNVLGGDARRLPFADASFDVVLSRAVLHNIPAADERAAAVREIARVLRPGGRVVIRDIRHIRQYARVLAECGLDVGVVGRGLVVPAITLGSLRPGDVVATRR
jgi:SAM-dependent methyltransferase